jgi:hypothetical protein
MQAQNIVSAFDANPGENALTAIACLPNRRQLIVASVHGTPSALSLPRPNAQFAVSGRSVLSGF